MVASSLAQSGNHLFADPNLKDVRIRHIAYDEPVDVGFGDEQLTARIEIQT